MGLPAGYTVRAATSDDLDEVVAVLNADDLEDAGEIVLDADFVRAVWSGLDFRLASDAWVFVEAGGAIVAYGHAKADGPDVVDSWGVVHPAHRGRGIGVALLGLIEERADQLLAGPSTPRFRHSVNAGDRSAAAMLAARGLRPVRHFWHMGIDLDGPVAPAPLPAGVTIGAIDPGADLPAMHAVLADAFAEDWGYQPEPFDRWAEGYAEGPNYDPTLWLLARDGDAPVAALTATVLGDRGWVSELGVVTPQRGRGIARALLRRSFATFAERGLGRAMLNVDAQNPTGATALYERAGMHIVKRWDLWERSSEDGRDPG